MDRFFASDNAAGAHPEILAALERANRGHALAYGSDPWTERAIALVREHFGSDVQVTFTFGGTGANVVGLSALVRPYHSILCAESAHLWRDECAGPERILGCKLQPVATPDGKLRPQDLEPFLIDRGLVHRAQPRVVSVTQATEWGTVYTEAELKALSDFCQRNELLLHLDGARLANAAVHLDVPLKVAATGADVLSLGGTKNGLLFGEALITSPRIDGAEVRFHQKQCLQLPSKMRFVTAQFEALLTGELWRRSAAHANRLAQRLGDGLETLPGLEIVQPVETNVVFARLPADRIQALQERALFAVWDAARSIVRIMAAFDTTEDDVDRFITAAQEILA